MAVPRAVPSPRSGVQLYNYGFSVATGGTCTATANTLGPPVINNATNQNTTIQTVAATIKIVYSLKIQNPRKKVKKFKEGKFQSPDELKDYVREKYRELVPLDSINCGYFQKGRGNGKIYLLSEDDTDEMYTQYIDSSEIPLWCMGREPVNEPVSDSQPPANKSRQASFSVAKSHDLQDVEKLYTTLQTKHKNEYTPHQLCLWANMLHVGKHDDFDIPPDIPMFGGGRRKSEKKSEVAEALTGIAEGIFRALKSPQQSMVSEQSPGKVPDPSPDKQIHICSELIKQLRELHSLLEADATMFIPTITITFCY